MPTEIPSVQPSSAPTPCPRTIAYAGVVELEYFVVSKYTGDNEVVSKVYDFLRGIIESSFGRATPSHVWTFSEVLKGSHVLYFNDENSWSIVFQSETEFDNCAPSLLDFFRIVDGIDWQEQRGIVFPYPDDNWLSIPSIYFRPTNGTVTSRPTMAPTPLRLPPGIVAFAP